uniref:F-box domain-containing protein n=1 Tax=Arundo donax TaxID=35708 RepID=A0A0A9B599_ARUDO
MGMPALQRLMSLQRDRQRQIRAQNGSIVSVNKRKASLYKQNGDGDSQAGKIRRCSIPELPEDIWGHIHSLMPLRDAARAACLSRAFLRSWRCHPNLTFNKDVLSSKAHARGGNFGHTIDRILRNHSGIGVKILNFELHGIPYQNLDSWLQVALTPGIEELTLTLCRSKIKFDFPCSLLSDGTRNSIRSLELGFCAFRPTAELGPLRSLTSMCLHYVRITGDELECLLSKSLALKQLDLSDCMEIICLKIPCVLQQFSCLRVHGCWRLREIESKAPNLSTLDFSGKVKLSLGETLRMKNLSMLCSNVICFARAELPSIMPNLERLHIRSDDEVVSTPMLQAKFFYLKHLTICMRSGTFSPSYDYFSLVSFLDASPSLETLILDVSQEHMEHESVFGQSSHLRHMAEHHHCCLKSVKITGFNSAKSLVELICQVLKNAVSLEYITLDTLYGWRCSDENFERCFPMGKSILREASRALAAIRAHIEDRVPATAKLTVLEPCSRCHAGGGW